jgi:hypothetical protein
MRGDGQLQSNLKNFMKSFGARLIKVGFGVIAGLSVFALPLEREILAQGKLSEVCGKAMRALGFYEPHHRAATELTSIPFLEVKARMNKPVEGGKARVLVGARRQAFVLTADGLYEISAPHDEVARVGKIENFSHRKHSALPLSSEWQLMEVNISSDGYKILSLLKKHSEEGSASGYFGEREEIYKLGEMLGDVQSRFRVIEPSLSQKRLSRLVPALAVGAVGLGTAFWGYDYAQDKAVNYLLDQSPWTQKEEGMLPWVFATSDLREKENLILHMSYLPAWSPVVEQTILRLLRDPSPEIRRAAVEALDGRHLTIEFWALFPEMIINDELEIRNLLVYSLAMRRDWPDEFWKEIPRLLQHPNGVVEEATQTALRGQHTLPSEVWGVIGDRLRDKDSAVRYSAMNYLRFHRDWPPEIWNLVPELLKERDRKFADRFAIVLGRQSWSSDFWALVPGFLSQDGTDVQETMLMALLRKSWWTYAATDAVADILIEETRGGAIYPDLQIYFTNRGIPHNLPPETKEKFKQVGIE